MGTALSGPAREIRNAAPRPPAPRGTPTPCAWRVLNSVLSPIWGVGVVKCQYWGDHPPKHEKNMKTIKISPTPTPGPYKDRYDRGIRVPLAPRGARPIDFYTFEWGYQIWVPRGTFLAVTAGRRGSCTHFAASSTSHPRGPIRIDIVEPTTEYGGQRVAGNRLLYF